MKKYVIVGSLFVLLSVGMLMGCGTKESIVTEENISFPEFLTVDLYGNEVDQTIFGEYKLTMVNVWGTFCGPCIQELPDLAQLNSEMPEETKLVGIVTDVSNESSIETTKAMLIDRNVVYENWLLDQALYDFIVQNVPGVPTTFFVDENGEIVNTISGARSKEDYLSEIQEVLKDL